jgi:Na+/H+ antiporter NhaD/arsenite permease-like protein
MLNIKTPMPISIQDSVHFVVSLNTAALSPAFTTITSLATLLWCEVTFRRKPNYKFPADAVFLRVEAPATAAVKGHS